MKRTILFISFLTIFSYLPAQKQYISKFLQCGFPSLKDYSCFHYDTIHPGKAINIIKSDNYNNYKLSKHFLNRFKIMRTTAYLIVKDDKIIYEHYWLKNDTLSHFNSFSMAKSIVSLLMGIAIDERKVKSIYDTVYHYLPWLNKGQDSTLRIIDLLTMSSGLNWSEDFLNLNSDIAQAYFGERLDSLVHKTHVVSTPGLKWNYQCVNTVLLALIIEKATGMPISRYAEEKLWKPLGAEHTAYWSKSADGVTRAFCCFYATARDFAKLGLLVLHNGYYNGKQIVSANYIRQAIAPALWLKHNKKPVDFYALQFWLVKHNGRQLPYFQGLYGQYIVIDKKHNAVMVRIGEMVNELRIEPVPPDLKLYLNAMDKIINNSKN